VNDEKSKLKSQSSKSQLKSQSRDLKYKRWKLTIFGMPVNGKQLYHGLKNGNIMNEFEITAWPVVGSVTLNKMKQRPDVPGCLIKETGWVEWKRMNYRN
jgi:hypothetical protein